MVEPTTSPAPTPDLEAQRLALWREAIDATKAQTDSIKANTAELISSRAAANQALQAMVNRPIGVSEDFVIQLFGLLSAAINPKAP